MRQATRQAMRRRLIHRLARNAAIVSMLIIGAAGFGSAGYHWIGGAPWIDAALNAVMILTRMGPMNSLSARGAKIFAMGYALFSGVFFLTMVGGVAGARGSSFSAPLSPRPQ